MKKSILSILIVITLLVSQIGVFAAFDDMQAEHLSWAKEAVEEMTDAGLIYGYGDGTFRPENPVTKQEALILIARVLGVNEDSSAEYCEIALEKYSDLLKNCETPYKEEISYLLYRGILSESDISLYASNAEATQPLKRYEAAILFTKIFEKDLSKVEESEISVSFEDLGDIPANAKAYVNYVVKNEIMYGTSDSVFAPNDKITRAMIATLLHRIIPVIDYSYVSGEMLRYNESTLSVRLTTDSGDPATYSVTTDALVLLDGEKADLNDFAAGTKVRITYSGENAIFIEGISSSFDTVITGVYNGYEVYEDATSIIIRNALTNENESYVISDDVTVSKNGKASSISKLSKTDYISASIKAGKVFHIEAEDKNETLNGVLESIEFDPIFALNINIDGVVESFDTLSNVSVKRNNKTVELSALVAGDKVTVVLEYGFIKSIVATSTTDSETGVISEIKISNTPSITLTVDGKEKVTFSLARDVEIVSELGNTIYDLRLGDNVKVKTEGTTITELKLVESAASSTTVTGEVELVQSTYGYIRLVDSSTVVFTNKAKVQDSSGISMSVKAIKPGNTVTIFGTVAAGSLEATLIIVNN